MQPRIQHPPNTEFGALQQALIERPDHAELLQAYYAKSVEDGKVRQAREFLDRLQQSHAWNHSIRRLRIALSLQLADYPSAMNAVETLLAFSTPDDGMVDSALAIRSHLGAKRIDRDDAANATLSLCMIVKNEQAFLGACLNSIKKLVDEIIVVDTGSTDRSLDIARVYGARVFHEKWCDDFAAVRNISLEKASGDWILILDADEIIASQDFEAIRQLVRSGRKRPCAYSLRTRNYLNLANAMEWQPNDGSYPHQEAGIGWFPTDKVRLFPNLGSIRFEYPVHEMVDGKVRQAGIAIQPCPVPIHHYGHLNEARNRRKAESYYELGYAKLDQLGDDSAALRELAVQAGQLGKWKEAIDLWHRFLKLRPGYHEAYANMAGAYWQLGQFDLGIDYSRKAIQADPGGKEGHYNLAVCLIMSGEAEKAAGILEKLLQKHDRYLPARFMMALVRCVTSDIKAGRQTLRDLEREMSPQAVAIAVEDLVEKLDRSGRSEDADAFKAAAGMST